MLLSNAGHGVFAWGFLCGLIMGLPAWYAICAARARWMNKHHPLPDGRRYPSPSVNRVWLGSALALLALSWSMYQVQVTHSQTVKLTQDVARCWQESYQSTRAQIRLNADNDLISRTQQGLQRQFDIATSDWLKELLDPPGDLADQPSDSPARKAWGLVSTAEYQAKLNDLGRQFDDQVNRRNLLDEQRANHKLPESTCGK